MIVRIKKNYYKLIIRNPCGTLEPGLSSIAEKTPKHSSRLKIHWILKTNFQQRKSLAWSACDMLDTIGVQTYLSAVKPILVYNSERGIFIECSTKKEKLNGRNTNLLNGCQNSSSMQHLTLKQTFVFLPLTSQHHPSPVCWSKGELVSGLFL